MQVKNKEDDRRNKDKYIKAKKQYGQNFLCDQNIINKIVEGVPLDSYVIEVGPGTGNLTREIAKRAKKVIAYEVDEDLVKNLEQEFSNSNVEILLQDFMEVDLSEVVDKQHDWIFVSNLPYYLTSKALYKLFERNYGFSKIMVMVQKEVADKLLYCEDIKDYNALKVLSEYYSDISLVTNVSRKCFNPVPNVDSAVIAFKMKTPTIPVKDEEGFYHFVRACFVYRRKVLVASLKEYGVTKETLEEVGLKGDIRVEEMKVEDFVRLYEVI